MASARSEGAPGRCRFAARIEEQEHVYEMLSFPIDEGNHGDTRVMNLYVDRTQTTLAEARLLLAERLASLGRVAQGVAHELNTPLATISTLATDMRSAIATLDTDAVVVEDLDESAALIRDETRRLGQITQALLAGGDLVRARADGAVPLSFAVERARAIVTAGQSEGRVQVEDMTSHQADADGDRLVQVLVNLLQNALDASRESNAEVTVSAIREGGEVEIRIVDGGTGLDPAIEARLFEPFATTKPPGEGTGLGLYMSYMIVRDMGGTLSVRNRNDESGTIATVRLPLARRRLEHVAS